MNTGYEIVPRYAYISDIIRGQQTVVDFDSEHDFVLNEIVSFRVTRPYGMVEMNNKQAKIIILTTTSITVDIDSTTFNPFIVPADLHGTTPPVCIPVASGIDDNYTKTVILNDAFDNVRTL